MLVRLTRLSIQPAQESLHCNANLQSGMQSWSKISVQTHTIRPGLSWKAPYGKFETRGVTSRNNLQPTLSACATRSDKITSGEQPFALFHSESVFVERINLRLRKSNRRRASTLKLCFTHASIVAWIADSRHLARSGVRQDSAFFGSGAGSNTCEKPGPDPESLFIFVSSRMLRCLCKCHALCANIAEFRLHRW